MTDLRAYYQLIIGSWMNLLLLAVPLGWVAYFLHWGSMAIFLLVWCLFALLERAGSLVHFVPLYLIHPAHVELYMHCRCSHKYGTY